MKILSLFGCLLLMLALESCWLQPTKYVQADSDASYGYYDVPLDSTRFIVSFYGNARTPVTTTDRYTLYRAAELTQEHGFDYFRVEDAKSSAETGSTNSTTGTTTVVPTTTLDVANNPSVLPVPAGSIGTGLAGTTTATATTTTQVTSSVVSSSSSYTLFTSQRTIRMYHGTPPADAPNVYSAAAIVNLMKPYIKRP